MSKACWRHLGTCPNVFNQTKSFALATPLKKENTRSSSTTWMRFLVDECRLFFRKDIHDEKKKKKMRMWRVQLAEQAIRFCIVKTKDSASWEHYHNSNFSKEKGMLFWQSWGEMKWLELNNQVSYNNRTVSVVVLHFMKATSNLQWNIIYGSICCICEKKIIISKSPFYDGYT